MLQFLKTKSSFLVYFLVLSGSLLTMAQEEIPDILVPLSDSSAIVGDTLQVISDTSYVYTDPFLAVLYTSLVLTKSYCSFNDSLDLDDSLHVNKEKYVIIGGVGDIMMGTAFPGKRYLPPGDNPAPLLESVLDSLKNTDILFANLEGPFSDYDKLAKRCKDTSRCYAFRVPEHYISTFYNAGFNLVSLANNHIGDFGIKGRNRTISLFDSLGIKYAGPHDYPTSVFIKDSVKYGFVAFSPNKGTLNINETEYAEKLVSMLNDSCDIVIVSFHGGAEGADHQHVTREIEVFYGENRSNVYEFSHRMIDAGADIIFGHGPHVTRAIEVYKERFIAYSLGNFCTYRRFNLSGPNGIAPIIKVKTTTDGCFIEAKIIAVRQNSAGHVVPDPMNRVIFKLRELITVDFPESVIELDENGNVRYQDNHE